MEKAKRYSDNNLVDNNPGKKGSERKSNTSEGSAV